MYYVQIYTTQAHLMNTHMPSAPRVGDIIQDELGRDWVVKYVRWKVPSGDPAKVELIVE